jgi:hypothetical protein
VLVDEQRGLLLIPEGTAIPMGVEFALTPDADALRSAFAGNLVAEEGVVPRRFVYAYAAPEKFVEARRRIAEAEAKFPQPAAELVSGGDRKAVSMHAGPARSGRVAANVADMDQTYYYYFWDNSYHAMRKKILTQSNGAIQYTAYGWVYSEAGDWDTKVVVNNSCPTPGYSAWTQSKTCYFYNAAGTCLPTTVTYVPPYPNTVTATINSSAALTRYLYPPCDLPCKSNSSSTMSVSFP